MEKKIIVFDLKACSSLDNNWKEGMHFSHFAPTMQTCKKMMLQKNIIDVADKPNCPM